MTRIDSSSVAVVQDNEDRVIRPGRLANNLRTVIAWLGPYRGAMVGVLVESTYHWHGPAGDVAPAARLDREGLMDEPWESDAMKTRGIPFPFERANHEPEKRQSMAINRADTCPLLRSRQHGQRAFHWVLLAILPLLTLGCPSGTTAPVGDSNASEGAPTVDPNVGSSGDNDQGSDNGSTSLNEPADSDGPPISNGGERYRPTTDTTWQWQLQPNGDGGFNTGYAVDVYDIDLFDAPVSVISRLQAQGRRVICYFSAGSFENFREDAAEFLPTVLGTALEGFPDERWLDIRANNVRRIMEQRLDRAVEKGCDGVEPDNVTGFENDTGFELTAADQLDFNRFLADEAHGRGLAVGLKNDLNQIPDLVERFDFSVNEQCHEFDECSALQPFIDAGKPVFNAEYADRFVNDPNERQSMCTQARDQGLRTLVLPLDLDDSFRLSCDP